MCCSRPATAAPRCIHEAAASGRGREATRRVDAAADRAASGRSEARALEDDLAGSVAELQIVRERLAPQDDQAPKPGPYKGLATFDADDAAYFFGRERLVAELVARLVGAPLLAVVGPSGSGSPPWYEPGCCRRWRAACCRAATTGRRR